MSRASTRRRAEALNQRTKSNKGEIRTVRTGLGLSSKAIALLVVTVAAATATWFFAVRPVGSDKAAVDRKIEDITSQIRSLEGRIESAKAGEPDVLAELEGQARVADALLPPVLSPIAALELLLPHAQRFGVSVSINPATGTPSGLAGATAQTLTVKFSGAEQSVRAWLAALDDLEPMTTVTSLSLRVSGNEMSGTADLALWGATSPVLAPLTAATDPTAPTVPTTNEPTGQPDSPVPPSQPSNLPTFPEPQAPTIDD